MQPRELDLDVRAGVLENARGAGCDHKQPVSKRTVRDDDVARRVHPLDARASEYVKLAGGESREDADAFERCRQPSNSAVGGRLRDCAAEFAYEQMCTVKWAQKQDAERAVSYTSSLGGLLGAARNEQG
jgi:hypothetical protein